ncbi:MAG: hypothetical protein NTU53_25995 [Planctomycetota bacterium]|nr:hypothetical protein [Planctomycetota bacterium]
MDFLKNQIVRLQEQFKTLNATQKMLAGALVAIIVMTLYGWTSFAGKAEMEPLLSQSMSSDDIGEIQKHLASSGIKYRVVGDRIEVPTDRKYEAMAMLAQDLPRETKSAFAEMIAKGNPFSSNLQQATLYNIALQDTLSQVLRRFPRVRNADVFINPSKERGFGRTDASATVHLNMKSRVVPDQKLVTAAADLVAGAASLKREQVKVIVDEASYTPRGSDELGGIDPDARLAMVRNNEQYLRERLMWLFSYIEGVRVDVSVKPNLDRTETTKKTVDPTNKVQLVVSEETQNEENNGAATSGGDPGMVTNGQLGMGGAAVGSESVGGTHEKMRTEMKVDYGIGELRVIKPPGDVEITSASMLVPRSHFVQVLKKMGGSEKEPDQATLDKFIAGEVAKLKVGLKTRLALASDDAVYVDSFTDLAPLAMAIPQAAGTSIALLATDHMKEITLGVLALASLFMVSMMVKKSVPRVVTAAAAAAAIKAPRQLGEGEEMVGEVSENNPVLEGVELDDESVRSQQVMAQVSDLVGENPEAAAMMVKRWMNRA